MNNYPSNYSYPPSSAPSNPQPPPPQIGFRQPFTDSLSNMSGYPPYPNQGAPGYSQAPTYLGYPPSTTSYQPSYPSSNPSYPLYAPAPTNSAPYGSSPYPAPGVGMGGYPAQPSQTSYPPAGYNPSPGYPPASGYPVSAHPGGYPQSNPGAYPSAPSGYMSQPTGPQYPVAAPPMSQQPPYQNYAQPYNPLPSGAISAPGYYPAVTSASAPYGSYGSTPAAGYNINQGTIIPFPSFHSKSDAEALRKAMKGLGTDEKAIIRILCYRTAAQRAQIALDYKTLYGKDLVQNLKDELSGNFEDVIVALMMPRAVYLARCLRNAISGIGTAELTIIEILCTSTNSEIREINAVYKNEYKRSLENDLKGDTSGYFKRLLVSLNVGNRDENPQINHAQAMHDAQRLYQAGEGRWGTDESVFNSILVSQSFAQLQVVFQEYERISNHTIEAALRREMSGDLLDGMIAIVKCVRNKSAFFAERLRNSLKGAGTVDNTLIRIVVSRSEIDLKLIKDDYQRTYGRSLSQDISNDTSGDYKRVLLEIIK